MITKEQVIKELRSDSDINRARACFSSWRSRIEQAAQQRQTLDPITMRCMEFEAVMQIWEIISGIVPSLEEQKEQGGNIE